MATGNLIKLRDYMSENGVNVGWDPNTSTAYLNDKAVNTSGLQNIGGNYYGTYEQLSNLKNQVSQSGANKIMSATNYKAPGMTDMMSSDYAQGFSSGAPPYTNMANKSSGTTYMAPMSVSTVAPVATATNQTTQSSQPNTDPAKTFYDTIQNTKPAPLTADTSNTEKSYDALKEAQLAVLRAAIAKGVSEQQQIISNAPAQYDPLKNQASYQGAQNLDVMRERMAATGSMDSGYSELARMKVGNQTTANITALNQQEQQVIDTANRAIADLQASGNLQEAQLVADNAYKKLQAIDTENKRIQELNYTQNQDYLRNLGTATNTLSQAELAKQQRSDQQLSAAGKTIDPLTGEIVDTLQSKELDSNIEVNKQKMDLANKEFDQNKAQQLWENNYKNNAFTYQKERDTVADLQFGKQYQLSLDKFAWDKSSDNPIQKAQIIENEINDIKKSWYEDPNSPENQQRVAGASKAQKELADLMAVPSEIYTKQANAKLDEIFANINQINSSAAASLISANASASNAGTSSNRLAWEKDPENPDNILKKAQAQSLSQSGGKGVPTENQILDDINSMKRVIAPSTGERMYSDNDILNYIRSSGLTPEQKARIANQSGISNIIP